MEVYEKNNDSKTFQDFTGKSVATIIKKHWIEMELFNATWHLKVKSSKTLNISCCNEMASLFLKQMSYFIAHYVKFK